jgi:hypothetical protein
MSATSAWIDASIPGSGWEVQLDLLAIAVTYRHRRAGTDEPWRAGVGPRRKPLEIVARENGGPANLASLGKVPPRRKVSPRRKAAVGR